MTISPGGGGLRAILLDIEGTTTPVAFVTEVLFPYARRVLRSHLHQHGREPAYQAIIDDLRTEHGLTVPEEAAPSWVDMPYAEQVGSAAAFAEWLMDRDRKSTALKELQGRLWEDGYRRGALVGDVFPDVRPTLERWRDRGLAVGIFSSGSVLAQQLLFRHSTAGDLTGLLQWYFDTHIGAKSDPQSYRQIAERIAVPPHALMFLSDSTRELDAARDAGLKVRLVLRPGNAPISEPHRHTVIHNLAAV